jgi:hypothetical protein
MLIQNSFYIIVIDMKLIYIYIYSYLFFWIKAILFLFPKTIITTDP